MRQLKRGHTIMCEIGECERAGPLLTSGRNICSNCFIDLENGVDLNWRN